MKSKNDGHVTPCGRIAGDRFTDQIRGAMRIRAFRRGEAIAHEGDAAAFFGVVLSGKVRILKHGPKGRDLTVRVLEPGQVFGLVAVLDGDPYPASVVGAENGTAGMVSKASLIARLRADPDMALELMEGFSRRLRRMTGVLLDAVGSSVASRLAGRLLEAAGGSRVVCMTRQELADLAGTTVETAIRVTKAWERAGCVHLSRGKIEVLDAAKLRACADESRRAQGGPRARNA